MIIYVNKLLDSTASLNQKAKNVVKVSHRRKFDPEQVKTTLGVTKMRLTQYKEMAEYLSQTRYKNEDIVDYFTRIFPVHGSGARKEVSKNANLAIDKYMEEQPGAELGEGTFWQLFNCSTFMVDHIIGRSQDTRLQSAWYGAGSELKQNALKLAVEMAEAA